MHSGVKNIDELEKEDGKCMYHTTVMMMKKCTFHGKGKISICRSRALRRALASDFRQNQAKFPAKCMHFRVEQPLNQQARKRKVFTFQESRYYVVDVENINIRHV
jgi:hypothetical protein